MHFSISGQYVWSCSCNCNMLGNSIACTDFFGGFVWILVDSMPMFLIMQVNLNDIYSIWYVVAVIDVGVLAVSLTKGILHYKVKQVV